VRVVAQVCVQELGPWACLQRIERWSEKELKPPRKFDADIWRSAVEKTFRANLILTVPARDMLNYCSLSRRDECRARMISFGYERTTVEMTAAGEEP
jgi:hypothetical protein